MLELILVLAFMLVVVWIVMNTAFKAKPTINHFGETHYHHYGNEKEEEKSKLTEGDQFLLLIRRMYDLQNEISRDEIEDKNRKSRKLKK